jgi:GDP-mannose 4,6-dehydratase
MKINKVLITGIAGSGGSYLAEYIAQHHPQVEIHGLSRWNSPNAEENLRLVKDKVKICECDLNSMPAVTAALERSKPDVIFHLASDANVRASFDRPQLVLTNNIIGTCNLFEAVRQLKMDPVIQHCSTSEVYGQVDPGEVPIKETAQVRPSSPYAVSKAAQDHLAWTYFRSYNMKIIRTRMFAYINPKRTDLFATAFVRQAVRIEAGLQKELLHGNLDSIRTMIDVRDAMESYWVAAEKCRPGEVYNIGGETTISVGDFLELVKKSSKVKIQSRVDPALLRPSDVTLQVPCVEKFTKETGWKPRYKFQESVDDVFRYWRERTKREEGK